MNKKIFFLVLCGVIFGTLLWKGYSSIGIRKEEKKNTTVLSSSIEIPRVTLILDDSEHIATYTGIPASTVLQALQYIATEKNIVVKTKQYDFGVFVEQIGDKANTNDRSWVYSVNGTSGQVASDAYQTKTDDQVLWQYTKPIF